MFSQKIPPRLESFEDSQVTELRDAALTYLKVHEFDWVGAADSLGLSLAALMELREEFRADFAELELRALAKLEKTVMHAALGYLEDNAETREQVKNAKYVLERQSSRWNKTQKVEHALIPGRPEPRTVNAKYRALIDEHVNKTRFVRAIDAGREEPFPSDES